MEINWKPSSKQFDAFNILNDNTTTELFYGGAAGGGKSYLGCCWLIISCLKHPNSRWLMGRAVLKALRESTLLTFFGICKDWGLKKGEHFRYNSIGNVITFFNGSEVYLKDLFLYPSDPEFDSLGSTEYTGAFIDECSQVTLKAKNIVMSRIRFKLEEFGLIPKTFMASNPSKNFLYYDFYKPWREGTLPPYRKFIPALVQDNPFISPHYIENLKKLDNVSKQRLLYGNFEYDDDPARLMEYDSILNIFSKNKENSDGQKYLTVDVARSGKDKTVFMYWKGLHIYRIDFFNKNTTKEVRIKIEKDCLSENIKRSNVIIDEDGVGGGVVDETSNVRGFVNNSKQVEVKVGYETTQINYRNLKSQCYYYLADHINKGLISCYKNVSQRVKELLIEELEQVKRKDIDKDGKLDLVPKNEIKELLGRSPDFSDAMMMRMYAVVSNVDKAFFFR